MTLFKIFTSTFDEEMKSRGFKRKGWLYYRLRGEILQGVTLKTINPYTIHFHIQPYWKESIHMSGSFRLDQRYWVEDGSEIDPDNYAYFRRENVQLNQDFMNICFEIAKKHILPAMDEVDSIDKYIEYCTPHWSGFNNERAHEIRVTFDPVEIDPRYAYLHIPYSYRKKIDIYWHVFDFWHVYQAFLKYAIDHSDIQKGYDLLCEKIKSLFGSVDPDYLPVQRYKEYLTEDGLERAKQLINDRIATMKKRLKDELGLEVK